MQSAKVKYQIKEVMENVDSGRRALSKKRRFINAEIADGAEFKSVSSHVWVF
jgi:hypothetical protein